MSVGTELARAYITLLPDMSGAGRSISAQLGGADVMRASDSAGKSIGSRMMGNVTSALKATTLVVGALGTAVAGIAIKGGIARQMNIEDAQAKLKGLGNSTETVTAIMQDALAAVKGTAYGLDSAATTAASAVAAGIKPGQQLEKYLKLTADAATIAGTSLGDMGSIINKVTSSGKAQMDNLNQLSDRGIPIMQWLGEEYGVTQQELSKMVSAGKVDAETFRKVLEDNIGGAALASGDTTRGAFANMGAALSRVGVTMTEWFYPLVKGVFNGVTTILDGLNDRMGPWADKFSAWFQEKAGPVVDGFAGNVLAQVDRIAAAFTLFRTGDFTVEIGAALGVGEDSRLVDYLLRAHEAAVALKGGVIAMFAAYKAGGDDVTSTGFAGVMERIGLAARVARDLVVGGVTAMVAAFKAGGDDVTSSGFAGFMERVGLGARKVSDAFKTLDFSSWAAFKDSLGPTGQQFGEAFGSIGDSLVALKPAFKEFLSQLPKVGGSIGTLALAALNALAGGLAFLAEHVDVIIKFMPLIVAGYVAWRVASLALTAQSNRLQMAQLAMAPVLLANNTLRLTSILLENRQTRARLALAASTATETAAEGANTGAQSAGFIARTRAVASTVAHRVATIASTVATRAAAAGQWLLNAAMTANPIGLIIAGIAALVAGLVWFFTQTETGKEIISAVWDGIQSAISGVSAWFTTTVVPALTAAWSAIAAGASWLYENVIKPVWSGIQTAITFAWGIIKPILDAYISVWTFIGQVFWNVWSLVIQVAWLALQAAFQVGWVLIRDFVFAPLSAAWSALGAAFKWVFDNVISPVWTGIQSAASSTWTWIKDNVFTPFGTAVSALGTAFTSVKDVIATAWTAIQNAATAPVNFIIETVYTNGIKKLFDTVAEKLGLDLRLPIVNKIGAAPPAAGRPINAGMYAAGGVLPGYTPGRDVHDFYSPTAGWLHLSGGEAIMRPEWTKAVGGPGAVASMNMAARNGQAFADGGVWGWVKDKLGDAWDFTSNAASAVGNFMKDPVKGALEVISKPVQALLTGIGAGDVGSILAGAPKALLSGIVNSATKLFGEARTDDGADTAAAPGAAMGYKAMIAAVQAALPGTRITSSYRPGAITAVGTKSFHGMGRAIDMAPSMALFDYLSGVYPGAAELLYSPAGGRQIIKGRRTNTSGVTRANHFDHVHWAMANGGVFDNGGWLEPGGVAVNLSNRPEPVFSGEQWDKMSGAQQGPTVHYYAAENRSLSKEEELQRAMVKATTIAAFGGPR